jgi:HAMP domain-containing protein
MPIDVTTALIAGIAVIAGTVAGGLIGFVAERWRAGRETVQHEAERQVARDDLRRTTFLELQDTMVEWMTAMGGLNEGVQAAVLANKPWAEGKRWGLPEAHTVEPSARSRMLKLVERVRDDELRRLIMAFMTAGIATSLQSDGYEQFASNYRAFLGSWRVANEALGVHLRNLL